MAFGLPISFGGAFDAGVGVANVGSALFGSNPNAGMMSIYQQMQDPMAGVYAAQQAATQNYVDQLKSNQWLIQANAEQQARDVRKDAKIFMKEQSFGYSDAGVLIEGSPVAMLENTRKQAGQMMRSILDNATVQMTGIERQIGATQNESKARLYGQQIAFQTDKANQMAGLASQSGGGLSSAISGLGNLFSGGVGSYTNPFSNPFGKPATTPSVAQGLDPNAIGLRGPIQI